MPGLRKLQMHQSNGNVVEVEVDEDWTCFKAAMYVAQGLGFPIFEKSWCIGLGMEKTPSGPRLFWAMSDVLVKELPDVDKARLFLASLPLEIVKWN